GTITLSPEQDSCSATQVQVFELNNFIRMPQFYSINIDARGGYLSREDYIRAWEIAEFDTVRNSLAISTKCMGIWGCKTNRYEWARQYGDDFDSIYEDISDDHKEFYGRRWDRDFAAAYKANQR